MSENNGTVTRNVLAVVGLIYVVAKGIQCFDKHIKQPLEKKLTEVFDDEAEASARWREAQRTNWNNDIETVAKKVSEKVQEKTNDPASAAAAEEAVREVGTLAR